MTWVRV